MAKSTKNKSAPDEALPIVYDPYKNTDVDVPADICCKHSNNQFKDERSEFIKP